MIEAKLHQQFDTTFLSEPIGKSEITYEKFLDLYTDGKDTEAVGEELAEQLEESGENFAKLLMKVVNKVKSVDETKIMDSELKELLKQAKSDLKVVRSSNDIAAYIWSIDRGLKAFKQVIDSFKPKLAEAPQLGAEEQKAEELLPEQPAPAAVTEVETSLPNKNELVQSIRTNFDAFRKMYSDTYYDEKGKLIVENAKIEPSTQSHIGFFDSTILRLPWQEDYAAKLPGIKAALEETFEGTVFVDDQRYKDLVDSLTKLDELYNANS